MNALSTYDLATLLPWMQEIDQEYVDTINSTDDTIKALGSVNKNILLRGFGTDESPEAIDKLIRGYYDGDIVLQIQPTMVCNYKCWFCNQTEYYTGNGELLKSQILARDLSYLDNFCKIINRFIKRYIEVFPKATVTTVYIGGELFVMTDEQLKHMVDLVTDGLPRNRIEATMISNCSCSYDRYKRFYDLLDSKYKHIICSNSFHTFYLDTLKPTAKYEFLSKVLRLGCEIPNLETFYSICKKNQVLNRSVHIQSLTYGRRVPVVTTLISLPTGNWTKRYDIDGGLIPNEFLTEYAYEGKELRRIGMVNTVKDLKRYNEAVLSYYSKYCMNFRRVDSIFNRDEVWITGSTNCDISANWELWESKFCRRGTCLKDDEHLDENIEEAIKLIVKNWSFKKCHAGNGIKCNGCGSFIITHELPKQYVPTYERLYGEKLEFGDIDE